MKVSVVIPFFNEEESCEKVINGLVTEFERNFIDYELILVNNGSMDKSPMILENLARQNPAKIKIVHVPVNQGYGWGIINGLQHANGEFIGYMCGDCQIKPNDVVSVFDRIINGSCDLAKVKRIDRKDGIIRKSISRIYNFLFSIIFHVKTLDVNGSPKIFKGELLKIINPVSKDWFIDAEIMIKLKYLNLKVEEIPVVFLPREKGKSHVKFSTILEFAENIFNYKFGKTLKEWKQKTSKS